MIGDKSVLENEGVEFYWCSERELRPSVWLRKIRSAMEMGRVKFKFRTRSIKMWRGSAVLVKPKM